MWIMRAIGRQRQRLPCNPRRLRNHRRRLHGYRAHLAPTFGADDAFVARAAGIPSLFMINKRGETRPMVDLTGKFYLLDELDEKIRKRVCRCRRIQRISRPLGEECLRSAISPTVDGKYDEKAAQAAETLSIFTSA